MNRSLPALLWCVFIGLERAHAEQGAGHGDMPSLAQWANFMRAVDADGTNIAELPCRLRLSKRAVRSGSVSALRRGWIAKVELGRGQRNLKLTTGGADAAARWEPLQAKAQLRWQQLVGTAADRALRAALESAVAVFPLELPQYPAGYGRADARITGGNGRDWKEVTRAGGDTVSMLPLSALLSQAIVAFAMAYEKTSPVALALTLCVIRRVPAEGCQVPAAVTPAHLSALQRHGFVELSADGNRRSIRLTAAGREVRAAHDERILAIQRDWCEQYGDQIVCDLRETLERIAAG